MVTRSACNSRWCERHHKEAAWCVFGFEVICSSQYQKVSELLALLRDRTEKVRFNTTAGNPVKKILLKLNLSDHRLFKDGGGVKEFQRSFRHSDTERLSRSDEVLKLKNFKKDATLKLFKSTNQVRYEHVGPTITSSQDGKVNKMAKRDYAWLMISSNEIESKRHVSSSRSGKDTHAEDAEINFVNDKQPLAEVQLTVQHDTLANEQQHSVQSEPIYDTHLLEKGCTNTIPDSTNMCLIGEERLNRNAKEMSTFMSLYLILHFDNMTILNFQTNVSREKVFANVALKNELRKLKGNSVDTKFAKPSILGKPVLQPPRNQSVVRQPNAFKSERPNFSKPRFASQVDVNNVLSKPVTQHYLPKGRESAFAKPNHMIASSSSRNSSKNMPRFSSNDMVHNYYLEEAKKKTQERDRKSTTSVMPSAKSQNTTKSCKSKPRSNNQTSRVLPTSKSSCPTTTVMPKADHSRNSSPFSDFKHFVCSTCQKCVFNANHDACITKFLKEVNSRAKIQPNKTRNSNKPVDPTSHTQKPGRKIIKGHSFSLNKSSAVHEKTNTPRSYLRWIPTGRIFNTAGLKWVPTGKTFTSSTTKVDCELPNGSNDYITNPYKCDQTLNVSAGTLNLSADQHLCFMIMVSVDNTSGPAPQRKEECTLQCALSSKEEKPSINADEKGIMPTEMELTLEQTQQGVSYEVSVLSDIEDSHGPSDAMHNPLPATQSQKDFVSKLTEIHSFLLTLSLRNIRVNSFTMKMEILLEPTSNKLMVEHAEYDESNTYVLERFNTTAGNPVKKILLKLNLSDHRLFKDGGGGS
ncbi:hypothetical protein Tco_0316555 [Tanacetum coccineum]